MQITVKNLYRRISPRKARPVLYGLRGMTAEQALTTMLFTNKKAAGFILGLIRAGIGAAKENYLDADKVIIKEIYCNEGPRLKRIVPWSKGQARRVVKKMAHFTMVLESIEELKTNNQEAITKNKSIKEIKSTEQAS